MKPKLAIYWCRRDFRLTDNSALSQAVDFAKKNQIPLLPIFIIDNSLTSFEDKINQTTQNQTSNQISSTFFCNVGLPRRLFLSRILTTFCLKFELLGINFEIFLGNFQSIFEILSDHFELFIFTNEDVETFSRTRDLIVLKLVGKENFYTFADQLTISPSLRSGNGTIYSIFTPFKNAGWESFMNAKAVEKVDLEKERDVFLDQNNQIYSQIQSLFEQNSQSLKSNKKTSKNIDKILIKNTHFDDLQIQIYYLIKTNWQFVVNKHNKNPNKNENKTDSNLSQNSSENLSQKSQKAEIQKLEFEQNLNKTNPVEINEISEITENDDNFVINLENILAKPDYLEWIFEEELILSQFEDFLENKIENYKENRDSLELDTRDGGQTSKISAALKWGLVSARTLKQKILDKFGLQITSQSGVVHYLNELIWREFYRYILFHEPLVLETEFQPKFRPRIKEGEIQNLKEKLSEKNIAKILENLDLNL